MFLLFKRLKIHSTSEWLIGTLISIQREGLWRVSLMKKNIATGVVHKVPTDLRKVLTSDLTIYEAWEDITPLARNEWICWIISAKKQETRSKRIKWMCLDLKKGKRRPCCWPGCPHRRLKN